MHQENGCMDRSGNGLMPGIVTLRCVRERMLSKPHARRRRLNRPRRFFDAMSGCEGLHALVGLQQKIGIAGSQLL